MGTITSMKCGKHPWVTIWMTCYLCQQEREAGEVIDGDFREIVDDVLPIERAED